MAEEVLTRSGWRVLTSSDIPAIPNQSGLLNVHQIDPTGYTGQIIQDIGSNTMGWRYPNHIGGEGAYIILPYIADASTVTTVTANDRVQVMRVQIPFTISISKLEFEIVTGDAGKFAAIGLYDSNGTLMVHTAPIDASASGYQSETLGSPVPFAPGSYWLAFTSDSTTVEFRAVPEYPETFAFINNGTTHIGYGANSSVAGALPSALGAITPDTFGIAIVKLQG